MGAIGWKSQEESDAEAAAAEEERLAAEAADAELAAAIDDATTLQELKDALRGVGRPAKVRARPA